MGKGEGGGRMETGVHTVFEGDCAVEVGEEDDSGVLIEGFGEAHFRMWMWIWMWM